MKLNREKRDELLEGKYPKLTYPGEKPCPIEVGEVYWVTSRCHLVVTKIRRAKKGDWVVVYDVYRKEAPLFLAQSPPKAVTPKDRERFTEVQAKGYTNSRARALDPGEAVHWDEVANLKQSKEAKQRHMAERVERSGDLLAACQDIRQAVSQLDPALKKKLGRELWTVRSRIDALEQKLRRDEVA